MKITLLLAGKTTVSYVAEGTESFAGRIKRYNAFDIKVIPDIKNTRNMGQDQVKDEECLMFFRHLNPSDTVVLLDEHGDDFTSPEFAGFIEKKLSTSCKNLVFIIGGAFGFSESLYKRANHIISLSRMTFPHQLIRLIFAEQLYRAFTIIKGEPYHHT